MTANLELRTLFPLPDELYAALGRVSARYGQVEHVLAVTIRRTTGISFEDACAKCRNLRAKDMRKEAKEAYRAWAVDKHREIDGAKLASVFDDLVDKSGDLSERRHDVIHCCWSIKDGNVTATREGTLLKWDGKPVTIPDVEKLADNLKQIVLQLNDKTLPGSVTGPEEEIGSVPLSYTPGYKVPDAISVGATATSTEKIAEIFSNQDRRQVILMSAQRETKPR